MAIDPRSPESGVLCTLHVDQRVIPDMQDLGRQTTGSRYCLVKYRPCRFGKTGLGRRYDIVKQMPDADGFQIGIAIGHGDQHEVAGERLQRRHHVGKEFNFISSLIEYCERRVDEFRRVAGFIGNRFKHLFAQEAEVVAHLPIVFDDGFANFQHSFRREFFRNARIVLGQPLPKPGLRPLDDRADRPQRIIEIDGNCTDAVQSGFRSRCQTALSSYNVPQFNQRASTTMKFLHTMVRVTDLEQSLDFYCNKLGLDELRRFDREQGRFTLVFLAAPGDKEAQVELTHNWDPEDYGEGRNFGHLAYGVDDIYAVCQRLLDAGVTINRPPHDGRMAFVRSPDNISIELLQNGDPLPAAEPWTSMGNTGHW